jgi:predicted dithiol-disulfide oxidoreductase (DUF899 family)
VHGVAQRRERQCRPHSTADRNGDRGLSPIERQVAFKVERGWNNLPMYCDVNSKFSRDYHGIMDDGADTAAYNVFTRKNGVIRHFWGAELGFESADPGKDPVTEPDLMVLWNVLDLTPGGRGTDWYPSITYP